MVGKPIERGTRLNKAIALGIGINALIVVTDLAMTAKALPLGYREGSFIMRPIYEKYGIGAMVGADLGISTVASFVYANSMNHLQKTNYDEYENGKTMKAIDGLGAFVFLGYTAIRGLLVASNIFTLTHGYSIIPPGVIPTS